MTEPLQWQLATVVAAAAVYLLPSTMLLLLLLYCWTLRRREKHDFTKLSHLGLVCPEHVTLTVSLVATGRYSLNSAGSSSSEYLIREIYRLFLSDSLCESGAS